MRWRAWAAVGRLGTALAALLLPESAFADERLPTAYALSWARGEGAEACPGGRALAIEVEKRLGRRVFDAAAERAFDVQVTRASGRYHSDVFVRDEQGRTLAQRALQSDEPGCSAVFEATALAIALVIDPEAASRPPQAAAASAAFEAPPPAPPAPPPPVEAPAPAVVAAPAALPAVVIPPAPAPWPVQVGFSLRPELAGGLVPGSSLGFGLALQARPGPRWGFALAGIYTRPRTARQGLGVYDIGLTRGSAALTFLVARSQLVQLNLSGGAAVGALHVGVREPAPALSPGDYAYFAADLGARLQVLVSRGFFLELGAAALLNLRRQSFLVAGQPQPVWKQPAVAGAAFLGVGVAFP